MGKLDWQALALAIPTVLSQFADELHQTCVDGQDSSAKGGVKGGANNCPPATLRAHNVTLETLLQHIEEGVPLTPDELACVRAGHEANGAHCPRAPQHAAQCEVPTCSVPRSAPRSALPSAHRV